MAERSAGRAGAPGRRSAGDAGTAAISAISDATSDADADTVIVPRCDLPGSDVEDTIIRFAGSSAPSPGAVVPDSRRFHRVRINHGSEFGLDTPIVIGRSPATGRVPWGVAPRLFTVPSARHEVSSTHLRVHQEGFSVVVTDLRSTNGTVMTAPGSAAVTILPGDSIVVGPGTMIDIGDGNIIEILDADTPAET